MQVLRDRALSRNSVVVIDWNWIQTRGANNCRMPDGWIGMLSEVVFSEVVGKAFDAREKYCRVLFRFINQNHGRLVLSRFCQDLVRRERPNKAPCEMAEMVHRSFSDELLRLGELSEDDFCSRMLSNPMINRDWERRRARFVAFASIAATKMAEELPSVVTGVGGNPERQVEDIRKPWMPAVFLQAVAARYRTPVWQDALSVFPDKFAIGRLTRILVWYLFQCGFGATKRFDNSWDDAQYAFMATYTKRIATNDRALQRCVRAVVPGVAIADETGSWLPTRD